MSHHHKHRVKSFHYEGGTIVAREIEFESLEEALAHIDALDFYSAKVYVGEEILMAFNGKQIDDYVHTTYA